MADRVCWNCETQSHMTPYGKPIAAREDRRWCHAYRCDNCGYLSIAFMQSTYGYEFESANADIHWQPVRKLGRRFEDVPNQIADAASEAYACYSIQSYRASVMLARAVVEAVTKEQGQNKGTLQQKITALEEARIIKPLTAETAHEIRLLGNNMAHGDFVEAISEQECDDVLNFMSGLLQEVYQQPANLTRFRDQRQRRNQPAAELPNAEVQPIN